MKRALAIAATALLLAQAPVWGQKCPDVYVTFSGVHHDYTLQPYISETNRVMLPIRDSLESIGCTLYWDAQTRTVHAEKNSIQVDIPVGRKEIVRNNIRIPIDTAADIRYDRIFLPLRPVMEAFDCAVNYDAASGIIDVVPGGLQPPAAATPQTPGFIKPAEINGGATGIFLRKQLNFEAYNGIQADITLPKVSNLGVGECPYVYFGFDGKGDVGNVEGGFQYMHDPKHPHYGKWTVCLRQGSQWAWGKEIWLEPGTTHHLEFGLESNAVPGNPPVMKIGLDGTEVVRKDSSGPIPNASVKQVVSMAMTEVFDGTNCHSRSEGAKVANVTVRKAGSDRFVPFESLPLYEQTVNGIRFGSAECVPGYLHYGADGSVTIHE